MRFVPGFVSGRRSAPALAFATAVVAALAATFAVAPACVGDAPPNPSPANAQVELELQTRHFERYEVGGKLIYFHERTIGGATVEGDFVNYQFDLATGALLARKTHWREDLPAEAPQAAVTMAEAEAIVAAAGAWPAESARLYIISPQSAVFPIRPAPENPCWVVRTVGADGGPELTVVDAVTGRILGRGVPPPYEGFSFTGPWECPGSGDWRAWSQSARTWFENMGYDTEGVVGPTIDKIRGHVKSDATAMFYEIAHGGSNSFNFACVDSVWQTLPAFRVGAWIGAYAKMPFAFIASCDGMCELTDNRFSYEFRKGSFEKTVTVGYCGMSSTACGSCWSWSIEWQEALFNYMSLGWTVKAAFDQAGADYPTCATNACMRFAGDEAFAVVPVVARDPEPPVVSLVSPNGGEWLEYGAEHEIQWIAEDNARVASVALLLSLDGGLTFPDTIASGEVNDSSYLWTVPDVSGHSARVRVVALDGVPNEGADVSDADFTVWGTTAGVDGRADGARHSGVPDGVVLDLLGANPAGSGWQLVYGMPAASAVRLSVYDVGGRLIERLIDARSDGGYHHIEWEPSASPAQVSPGVYFLRLDCDAGSATAKVVIAR